MEQTGPGEGGSHTSDVVGLPRVPDDALEVPVWPLGSERVQGSNRGRGSGNVRVIVDELVPRSAPSPILASIDGVSYGVRGLEHLARVLVCLLGLCLRHLDGRQSTLVVTSKYARPGSMASKVVKLGGRAQNVSASGGDGLGHAPCHKRREAC